MDIFISWSGERSNCLAEALKDWLPKVINAVRPWLSSADIDKGARWSTDVASKLENSKVGIICLTPSNRHSDWILFEAGALSKTLQKTLVCPLLVDLNPSDITGPLAQFQAARATKDDIKSLLVTINSALGENALADRHVDDAFEVWWPRLEPRLATLPQDEGPDPRHPEREIREILEEILALVRSSARSELYRDLEIVNFEGKRGLMVSGELAQKLNLRDGEILAVRQPPLRQPATDLAELSRNLEAFIQTAAAAGADPTASARPAPVKPALARPAE